MNSLKRIGAVLVLGLSIGPTLPSLLAQERYVAFGDSVTDGVGDTTVAGIEDPAAGYPSRLQTLLPEGSVVENQGISGLDTIEALSAIGPVLLEGGDTLLLMLGTNDVSRGYAVEDIIFNLRQLARRARNQGMDVVVATVIPRLPGARRGDGDGFATSELNQEIRNLAGLDGHQLVDPFEAFLQLERLFSTYYWQADDPVGHPNSAGYDVLAQTFSDVLQDTDTAPPVNGSTEPTIGTYRVPRNQPIRIDLWDLMSGIDRDSLQLFVNGEASDFQLQGDNRFSTIVRPADETLRGPVEVRLSAQDRSVPPNTFNRLVTRYFTRGTVFPDADFDVSGRVDGEDLVLFGRAFGSSVGDGEYREETDLNGDGTVDGMDLALFASQFGEVAR